MGGREEWTKERRVEEKEGRRNKNEDQNIYQSGVPPTQRASDGKKSRGVSGK